jgi:hypothetical protein
VSFVNINTTTPNKTSVRRGDCNIATYVMGQFNKKTGTGTRIFRGYCCSQDNTVTPNAFTPTTTKAGGLVVVSFMPLVTNPHYANYSGQADGMGEDVTADEPEAVFQAIVDCERIVLKSNAVLQPGDQIMTDASGQVTKYDGSGAQYIKGAYLGLPGGTGDAAYIKQACNVGDLVVIDFDGGA